MDKEIAVIDTEAVPEGVQSVKLDNNVDESISGPAVQDASMYAILMDW